VLEDMVAVLVTTEGELEGVQARVDELEQQSTAIDTRLTELNATAAHAKELRRERERAEKAYTLYREKTDTWSISAAMSRAELVNTSISQRPTVSSEPVGPGKLKLLLLGLFVAGAGGIALALLLEFLDHSLSTPEQLERRLGIAHLASVPEGATDGPLEIGLAGLAVTDSDAGPAGGQRRLPPLPALVHSVAAS